MNINIIKDYTFNFFLRAYNDIDHIVPVIDHFLHNDLNCAIFLMDLDSKIIQDSRIQYIIKHHPKTKITQIKLKELKGVKQLVLNILPFLIKKAGMRSLSKNLPKKFLLRQTTHKLNSQAISKFVTAPNKKYCWIFDHGLKEYTQKLIPVIKSRNELMISLPHAIDNWENHHIKAETTRTSFGPNTRSEYIHYDCVFVPSHLIQDKIKYPDPNVRCVTTGSARFDSRWIDKLAKIFPSFSLSKEYQSKIVVFLTKKANSIFEEEVFRYIKILATQCPQSAIVVKLHTRGMKISKKWSMPKNVILVGNEVSSSPLIDWADVAFFSATSVIVEAIIKNKPVYYFKRTVANKLLFEPYFESWEIECKDDLFELTDKINNKEPLTSYTQKERDHFLREIVGEDLSSILDNYLQETIKLISQREKDL